MKPTYLIKLFLLPCLFSYGNPVTFDFKDPKNVNNIIFQMDALSNQLMVRIV